MMYFQRPQPRRLCPTPTPHPIVVTLDYIYIYKAFISNLPSLCAQWSVGVLWKWKMTNQCLFKTGSGRGQLYDADIIAPDTAPGVHIYLRDDLDGVVYQYQ